MSQLLTDSDLNGILREHYEGGNGTLRLAQNLVQIFGAQNPDGPTITTPVTIKQTDPNAPALTVIPSPDPFAVPAVHGIKPDGGSPTPAAITWPGPSQPPAAALAAKIPVVLYGVVQSGAGNNYVVRCWVTNPNGGTPLGDFNVVQRQIDPAETIPPLTECFVWAAIDNTNTVTAMYITVPVFIPTS